MQLTLARAVTLLSLASLAMLSGVASAQPRVEASSSYFREAGGPLYMNVVTPRVDVSGVIRDKVILDARWDADVVSGASVAVVDAPGVGVDGITSATRLADFRNQATGVVGFQGETTRFTGGYSYGRERDYYSHSFFLAGRTELYERNTVLELRYARGYDHVCNLRQPMNSSAVDRQRMPTSDGCYGGADRIWVPLDIQTFQGSWTQNWTPIFNTQVALQAQLLDGFQSNPYRGVWLGRSAAQEHLPNDRARYSANVESRIYLRRTHSTLRVGLKLYRDTWDILAGSAELGWEQAVRERLRLRVLGRAYGQTSAAFYSDDYVLEPRGQYFTGDRELSRMQTYVAGFRLDWTPIPGEQGASGRLENLRLVAAFDYFYHNFPDFHYGSTSVPNNQSILATLGLELGF